MARDRAPRDDDDEDRPRQRPDETAAEDERPKTKRKRPPADDPDRDAPLPPQTKRPASSLVAAVFLLLAGVIAGVSVGFTLATMILGSASDAPPSVYCGLLLSVVLLLFGVLAGVRTIHGNSTEPIVNGVLAVVFSLPFLGVGILLFVLGASVFGGGLGGLIGGSIMIVASVIAGYGTLWLVAGILLFVGRGKYVRWRQYRKEQRRAEFGDEEPAERPKKKRPKPEPDADRDDDRPKKQSPTLDAEDDRPRRKRRSSEDEE